MNLLEKYHEAFMRFSGYEAFSDGVKKISYKQFSVLVQSCRNLLEQQPSYYPGCAVGVLHTEKAETYAAIFAIWFAGGYFVPLHPASPAQYNSSIINNHKIRLVFVPDGTNEFLFHNVHVLTVSESGDQPLQPVLQRNDCDVLYVLNTSGSTGVPKNVPINLKNIEAFVDGFLDLYTELNATDKYLQTYDLTADAAFTGYLIPLLTGAAVYTVPAGHFKPFQVVKILSENPITWVQVTPSLLACLQPFFGSLWFNGIKHFHFGGEALPIQLAEEWRKHVPNAEISNVYGPTETTITATIYKCLPGESIKSRHQIVSIGKPLKKVFIKITGEFVGDNKSGELYIGGAQVMDNYLFTQDQPFEITGSEGTCEKYYPSGDWVETDDDGFLYFVTRKDDQIKVNGYRVDLTEIENLTREFTDGRNTAAAAIEVSPGLKKLIVFVENFEGETTEIIKMHTQKLPFYKVPGEIVGTGTFPLSNSGKTDRKKLLANYFESIKDE
jgi:acyl-coenzyme A synthetase/AMP-(fatty) acid ligase